VAASSQGRTPQHGTAEARVVALLARHGSVLMRVARQASLCHDDAADALQRALEIYVRRLDTVEQATEAAWLKVVVRHEAYAIRRSRGDCVADPDVDLDAIIPAPERSVEEQVLSGDRVSRSAEALRGLKPDEARALMLKAHGLSYEEIGQRCGWTYTKVNRCLTEGRRRFMKLYAELEAGTACERFAPLLRALASGAASSEQMVELRPHLRRCSACRATVRDLHLARLPRPSLLAPLPLLGWIAARLRDRALHLVHRVSGCDVAETAVQMAAWCGGGRAATLGTFLGLCLTGLGAGTVCVVSGVMENPIDWLRPERPKLVQPAARATPTPTRAAERSGPVVVRATPTPALVRARPRRTARPPADPSQGRKPSSHEEAPASPAPRAATAEFAAAGTEPAAGAVPASAPATGGGEFGP
jgi:RNA polymerase sigma factor (sigma-70 family)